MFTVGYGDIVPQNVPELIACIAFTIFSSIQLSYTVSTVGTLLQELKNQAEEVRLKLKLVN
jgi:hypothetical protein